MRKSDIGVIGAGIVGCAIARHLALSSHANGRQKITVLEKHPKICMETSRFNSWVVHSGFHEKPETLKAKLSYRGSRLIKEYAESKLPSHVLSDCGMLIAVSRQEWTINSANNLLGFFHLLQRGSRQDIKFKFLGPRGIKEIEPNINALGGIFIPGVLVVNPISIAESLYKDARAEGVDFVFNSRVMSIGVNSKSYTVSTQDGQEFEFGGIINSAGLYADEIALMAKVNEYCLYPWRGEYYEIIDMPRNFIRHLVYPAVPKNSPSKGIHFSPHPDGKTFIGPTAKLVKSKEDYTEGRLSKEIFLKAARKFYPDIQERNLNLAYAGIRPKLRKDGSSDEDFIIRIDRKVPLLINLIAIESPGLSASMAIAEYVSKLIESIERIYY